MGEEMSQNVTNEISNVTTLRPKPRKRGVLTAKSVTTLAAIVTILAGCQTAPKGTFCALSEAQRPSQDAIDNLSDEQVAALLRHNRLGQRICGWKQ